MDTQGSWTFEPPLLCTPAWSLSVPVLTAAELRWTSEREPTAAGLGERPTTRGRGRRRARDREAHGAIACRACQWTMVRAAWRTLGERRVPTKRERPAREQASRRAGSVVNGAVTTASPDGYRAFLARA